MRWGGPRRAKAWDSDERDCEEVNLLNATMWDGVGSSRVVGEEDRDVAYENGQHY